MEQITIPPYQPEDFHTDAPYDFLYSFSSDDFVAAIVKQQLKEYAQNIGVKGFITMWNAYLKTKSVASGVRLENVTQFDNQELELFSGRYVCNDYGVSVMNAFGYEQIICLHPIMPVERLINVDTGDERLRIAFKKGQFWRSIVVEKSVLASTSNILQLANSGVLVNSENAKSLSTYLFELEQLNYDELPEQKSVSRLGWVGEHGFAPFVENLFFDGENSFKGMFNAVRSKGDREKWIQAMKKVRKEKSVARFALAASFASVLIQPCGLLNFFVHFFGGQGTGKSVSLMCAASVWANPKMGEYITTFNSTDVGQETTASFLNSLPMCIDELQIQASAGIKEFDRMIYKLAEGVGKTRGNKNGGLRSILTWKNCMITTGEFPIINANSMGGASARVIEIECSDKVYSDLIGLCSVINENYGFAGREFVDWLQKTPGAVEKVNHIQKTYFRELLKYDSTDKQAASAAALLAADLIASKVIFKDDNYITVEEMVKMMSKREEVDPNNRCLSYLYEQIEVNPNRFGFNAYGDYNGELWGKKDETYIYIIKSVFDRMVSDGGFNAATFLSWAKRKNLLKCDEGKNTKKTRINGDPVRCVAIIRQINEN